MGYLNKCLNRKMLSPTLINITARVLLEYYSAHLTSHMKVSPLKFTDSTLVCALPGRNLCVHSRLCRPCWYLLKLLPHSNVASCAATCIYAAVGVPSLLDRRSGCVRPRRTLVLVNPLLEEHSPVARRCRAAGSSIGRVAAGRNVCGRRKCWSGTPPGWCRAVGCTSRSAGPPSGRIVGRLRA